MDRPGGMDGTADRDDRAWSGDRPQAGRCKQAPVHQKGILGPRRQPAGEGRGLGLFGRLCGADGQSDGRDDRVGRHRPAGGDIVGKPLQRAARCDRLLRRHRSRILDRLYYLRCRGPGGARLRNRAVRRWRGGRNRPNIHDRARRPDRYGRKEPGRVLPPARIRGYRCRLAVRTRYRTPPAFGDSAPRLRPLARTRRDRGGLLHPADRRRCLGNGEIPAQPPRLRRQAQAPRKLLRPRRRGLDRRQAPLVGIVRHCDHRAGRELCGFPRRGLGCHRAAGILRKDRLSRALRHPDLAPQPPDAHRDPGRGAAVCGKVAYPLRLPDDRSRPVQGGQRFARPSGR